MTLSTSTRPPGRHRAPVAPSTGARTLATVATVGVVAAAPLAFASPAQAATSTTWNRLAACESGGRWSINTGNGYYGGLQFSPSTWRAFGGRAYASNAHLATRAQQIAIAERVLRVQGWGAWPACSRKLGLTRADAAGSSRTAAPVRASRSTTRAALPAGRYVVRRGDTLSRIAARYGVRGGWKAVYQANRRVIGPNPNMLRIGQRLVLPR